MISNYFLEDKLLNVAKRKKEWVDKKVYLEQKLKTCSSADLRKEYVTEKMRIERVLADIKIEQRDLNRELDSQVNIVFKEIFNNIFTKDQMNEIRLEAESRVFGNPPTGLSFNVKDCIDVKEELTRTKKQVMEYANKLISTRAILTGIVQDGCKQFDEAKFLKVIAPINRNVLPLDYITEIKKRHFIK